MFDFLWSGGISNSTSQPTPAANIRVLPNSAVNVIPKSEFPAEERCVGACSFGTASVSQKNHYRPAEYIPAHVHIHNVSEAHSLIFLGNPNRTYWTNNSYQQQLGGYTVGSSNQGVQGGLGGSISSWYQLNLGLIGIGALAVVGIIASRNFFSNYVYHKKSKYESDYYDYDPYESYGGQYRRDWYDEWYDRWYRENGGHPEDEHDENGYDGHRFEGAQERHYPYKSRYKRDLNSTSIKGNYVDTGQPGDSSGQNGKRNGSTVTDRMDIKRNETDNRKTAAHCGFRLTCELTRQRERVLSELEWSLLRQTRFKQLGMDVFQVREAGGASSRPAMEDYNVAEKLGLHGFECEKLAGSCPLRRWQIRRMLLQFEKKLKIHDHLIKNIRS